MVIKCAAFGCSNQQVKGNNCLNFHRFPFNRPDVLSKWIVAIRRENFKPTKYSRICSSHFSNYDYQVRPGAATKRLKDEAVPSIFEFPAHLQRPIKKRQLLVRSEPIHQNAESNKKKSSKYSKKDSLLDSGSSAYSNLLTNSLNETSNFSETDEPTVKEDSSGNKDPSSDSYSTTYSDLMTNPQNRASNFCETDEPMIREGFSIKRELLDSTSTTHSNLLTDSVNETLNFNKPTFKDGFSEIRLLKKKLHVAENIVVSYGKKIKTLQQKNQRYKSKIKVLTSLLYEIKENRCITNDELEGFLKICVSNQKFNLVQKAPHHELWSAESSEEFESE